MSESRTDVIRRVFDEDGQHFVEVGPWTEDHSWIALRTEKRSGKFFGPLNLQTFTTARQAAWAAWAEARSKKPDVQSSR